MQRALTSEAFCREPIGRWTASSTGLVWCASASLCGIAMWGRPTADDAHENIKAYDAFYAFPGMTDLIMDGSAIDGIDQDALSVVMDWSKRRLPDLQKVVRRRIGLIP